jgi:chromosome segregation ATPase
MFKSIGLNIDHPETFFVQQGKITKIVSFKPNDIMEMLMESAGVAFYQEIAENSKLIMKEKSEKLDTTHERMKVSFGPKLLLLEKERAKVAEYESLKVELDRVTELLNRATLYKAHKTLKSGKDMLLQLEVNMKELEKVRDHYRRQIESFDAKTGSDNAEIRELKENITVIEKEIENLKKVTYKTKSEREEKVQEKRLKTEKVQKLRETQALKEREIAQAQASKESTEVVIARLKERLEDIQQEKNQLTAKMSGGSSGDVALPLQNQLEKQRNNLLKVQDDIERTQKQIKNVHESLADGEKIKKKIELEKEEAERDEARLLKEMDSFSNIVRTCNSRIEK